MPDITITSLTATGGAQQITLAVVVSDGNVLPYLQLAAVEIWAASVNDRASAVRVGEGPAGQLTHTGLPTSATRWYWARARDRSSNLGPWFPASATAGVSATTTSTALAPGSVGSTELANGAVTGPKIAAAAVTADKITVSSLSALTANLGTVTAGSLTGVTITGATVQTATSGRRVTMTASDNYLRVINASGAQVASIGETFSGDVVMSVARDSATPAVVFTNTSSGGALQLNGLAIISAGFSAQPALTVTGSSGSGNNHGIRGRAIGGGSGLVGVPAASGGFAVYGEVGSIAPFTGSHDGLIARDAPGGPGDIVIDTGRILMRSGMDDAVGVNALAETVADPRVYGVISRRVPFEAGALMAAFGPQAAALRDYCAERFDRLVINSLGEGLINVCGRGGDIAAGDLLCASSLPGAGQRQGDGVMRASTVAKAREAVRFTDPDEVRRIACTYHCG
ncbi:phage tail protein [Pannonibacter tanglangensis]|uniref:Uncharacterized protein n=1 Tax=Pannonibacter tanglangensis TaxID=2750084 RepID=A0ABW9ZN27_9HYPH|nr:hypothetical protein [Pannonibacter sp. XCT-34]NBN64140.1 hypothetical protein [Pannonibacter sp. XCT-34]